MTKITIGKTVMELDLHKVEIYNDVIFYVKIGNWDSNNFVEIKFPAVPESMRKALSVGLEKIKNSEIDFNTGVVTYK